MDTVTFVVFMEMSLEEWKDHCFGSGWSLYEWWVDAEQHDNGVSAIWYKNADYPEAGTERGFQTYQELADVASKVAATDPFVSRQLSASDLDADAMDRIMQTAFLGEIIYG
jgi:hypothetical protein